MKARAMHKVYGFESFGTPSVAIFEKENNMKEFRIVDNENNVYGEFDGIVSACKEAKRRGCKVLQMDIKNKIVKEIISETVVNYMASK